MRTSLLTILAASVCASLPAAHVTYGFWSDGALSMSAYASNFSPGSSLRTALEDVVDGFLFEQPSNGYFLMSYDDDDVAPDNDENEFWFSGATGGPPAECLAWLLPSNEIVEADVIFYVDGNWATNRSKSATLAYGGAGRLFDAGAYHELGHALGLAHEPGQYNVMGQEWDHVTCNSQTIRGYLGEDAADGLVQLYGSFPIEDVGASLFRYFSSSGGYSVHTTCSMVDAANATLTGTPFDGQWRFDVPIGRQVGVEFTYDNNGNSAQTIRLGFYVSTNDFISTSDRLVFTETISISRDDPLTRTTFFTLPTDLNQGQTYYLGVIVDDDDQLAEAVETNNEAYHAFQVVCDSTPDVQPFSAAPNPDSFTSTMITLGSVFVMSVDLGTTGHSQALPFGFDTPVDVTLSGGQRLLCIDGGGSGEILGFTPQAGPAPNWFGSAPNESYLCGYVFSMQAIHFGGVAPFALSNALDVTVGL